MIKKKLVKKDKPSDIIHQDVRHLGVVIESVNDNVKLVAEQYGDIKNILDVHTKTLESHTEMIGKLAIDTAIVKEGVEFIKNSLKKKIDVDEFAILERRVALLEKRK